MKIFALIPLTLSALLLVNQVSCDEHMTFDNMLDSVLGVRRDTFDGLSDLGDPGTAVEVGSINAELCKKIPGCSSVKKWWGYFTGCVNILEICEAAERTENCAEEIQGYCKKCAGKIGRTGIVPPNVYACAMCFAGGICCTVNVAACYDAQDCTPEAEEGDCTACKCPCALYHQRCFPNFCSDIDLGGFPNSVDPDTVAYCRDLNNKCKQCLLKCTGARGSAASSALQAISGKSGEALQAGAYCTDWRENGCCDENDMDGIPLNPTSGGADGTPGSGIKPAVCNDASPCASSAVEVEKARHAYPMYLHERCEADPSCRERAKEDGHVLNSEAIMDDLRLAKADRPVVDPTAVEIGSRAGSGFGNFGCSAAASSIQDVVADLEIRKGGGDDCDGNCPKDGQKCVTCICDSGQHHQTCSRNVDSCICLNYGDKKCDGGSGGLNPDIDYASLEMGTGLKSGTGSHGSSMNYGQPILHENAESSWPYTYDQGYNYGDNMDRYWQWTGYIDDDDESVYDRGWSYANVPDVESWEALPNWKKQAMSADFGIGSN